MPHIDEVLSSSDESAIDPFNPLVLGGNDESSFDESSFDESVEFNYVTEQEQLEKDREKVRKYIEYIVCYALENVSTNMSNKVPP